MTVFQTIMKVDLTRDHRRWNVLRSALGQGHPYGSWWLTASSGLNVNPVGCMGLIQPMLLMYAWKYDRSFCQFCMMPKSNLTRVSGFEKFISCLTIEYLSTCEIISVFLMKIRCHFDAFTEISNSACNFRNGSTLFELTPAPLGDGVKRPPQRFFLYS